MQTQADFMAYAACFPLPEEAVPAHADAAARLCAGDRHQHRLAAANAQTKPPHGAGDG